MLGQGPELFFQPFGITGRRDQLGRLDVPQSSLQRRRDGLGAGLDGGDMAVALGLQHSEHLQLVPPAIAVADRHIDHRQGHRRRFSLGGGRRERNRYGEQAGEQKRD